MHRLAQSVYASVYSDVLEADGAYNRRLCESPVEDEHSRTDRQREGALEVRPLATLELRPDIGAALVEARSTIAPDRTITTICDQLDRRQLQSTIDQFVAIFSRTYAARASTEPPAIAQFVAIAAPR